MVGQKNNEIVVSRTVNAPRELVWRAWTEPVHLTHWWGPVGFSTTVKTMEFKTGGIWEHTMHGPDGTDYPNRCVFTQIKKPELIAFKNSGGKSGGKGISFESTWTFEEVGRDKTKVTIRMVFASAEERDHVAKEYGAVEGAHQTLERLDRYVANAPQKSGFAEEKVVITRIYEAPPEVVFKAWTDPKQLMKWFGPKHFTNPICEVDAREGGAWKIVMRSPGGTDHPCEGIYEEFVPPSLLVFTNNAVDQDGKLILEGHTTVRFEDHDRGFTKLTLTTRAVALVPSAVINLKGMEAGWTQSLEKLTEIFGRR